VRTGERYQKNIKNETEIHPQIYEQSIQISCSKKGYPKDGKSSEQLSKKEMKNETMLRKKTCVQKEITKKKFGAESGTLPQGPGNTI
jgi:hypothetical protein